MERCEICGVEKKVCKTCGSEIHKKFHDFILRAEVIYAIFMAWGFAAAAEAVIKAGNWAGFPLLVIATFVLIRFFFAPTKNLYSAAVISEKVPHMHKVVFLLDFPLLIVHSFAYYYMCVAIGAAGGNAFRFFQWMIILLAANVVWLVSIALRMRIFGKSKSRNYWMYIKWSINNFVTVALFFIAFGIFNGSFGTFFGILFTKGSPTMIAEGSGIYWIFVSIALLNCVLDVVFTASDYLGFD